MRLQIQVENAASDSLRQIARRQVVDSRKRMVERGMQAALESTAQLNPIRTGRSRAAWVAALNQLQGHSSGVVSSGAIAEGASRGSLSRDDSESATTLSATNAVSYVPFLEYGTSKMRPFSMARRSLAAVQRAIARWFRLS